MLLKSWRSSVGSKIVLILLGVVVLNTAVDSILHRYRITSSFSALEMEKAGEDLQRAISIVDDEVSDLAATCRRWAVWDDTYRYVGAPYEEYEESNLGPNALEKSELDLLYVCDPRGRVVWGRIEDPLTREAISLREFPSGELSRSNPLIGPRAGEEAANGAVSGLMGVEGRPMMVAAHEIRRSSGDGESGGTLIVGRFLDGELLSDLGRRAKVDFEAWPLHGAELPERVQERRDQITATVGDEWIVDEVDADELHLYTAIEDLHRAPEIILRAEVARQITARGRESARFATLSSLCTAFLILFVLLRVLQRIAIGPIQTLTRHVVEIGMTDDTSAQVGMDRADEIGLLSQEFDRMMDKLAKSREEIVKTARRAGMSEIATGVLHNVGNVLNSVNVSARVASQRVQRMELGDLKKLTEILKQNEASLGEFVTEDPRGKHLLPFLEGLGNALGEQREAIVDELRTLGEGIGHMAELVRSQQDYAGARGVFETAFLGREVDAAIRICGQAFESLDGVEIVREYDEVPPVTVDRQRLMEILVNLIKNAEQAMEAAGVSPKRLVVRLRQVDDQVLVEIEDNGIGIAEENIDRVFGHGFTTKKNGHGFGLHVSANAATEMGLSLRASSEGEGRGATFVLGLPRTATEAAAAA